MKTALKRIRDLFKKAPHTQIITFVLITSFLAMASPIISFGASTTVTPTPTTSDSSSDSTPSSYRTWLDGGLDDLASGAAAMITGSKDWSTNVSTTTDTSSTSTTNTATYSGGAIQDLASFGEYMYGNEPASAMVWAQEQYYTAQNTLNLNVSAAEVNTNATSTYSPGTGYEILQSVKGLWQVSANIVYAVLMIVMIVIAFLIILRRPLGGKEIVTLANSIPSVIVTLVLVVFSYALCGLFIDAIYLGSNVAYNLLIGSQSAPGFGLNEQVAVVDANGKTTGETTSIKNTLQPDDPQMSIWNLFSLSGTDVCSRVTTSSSSDSSSTATTKCAFSYLLPATWQSNALGVAINKLVEGLDSLGVTNGLMELILALAVLQTSIKLFFGLLTSYLTLSFYPIIAPFVFLQGALPGGTMKALDSFFKTLGAAALNFIVIYICFLLIVLFGHSSVDSTSDLGTAYNKAGQIQWVPPLLGYSQSQIFGSSTGSNGGTNIITSLLIFGLYMAMPNVLEMIKEFMKVTSPFAQLAQTGKDMTRVSKETLGYVGKGVQSVMSGNFFGAS